MSKRLRRPCPAWLPLLGLALVLGACEDTTAPTAPDDPTERAEGGPFFHWAPTEPIKFLTYNVFLGADIDPVVASAGNPAALVGAAALAWQQVQDARMADRAAAIARRIAWDRPHLVGLQEAFQFVEIDPAAGPTGLVLDFVDLIRQELGALGAAYDVVAVQNNTSSILPVAVNAQGQPSRVIQFTDRIAVLARTDVSVLDIDQATYDNVGTQIPVVDPATSPPGLVLTRGWIRVDAEIGGRTFHFVNTHLEGQGFAPVQAAQVAELQDEVLDRLEGTTVLVGDLNSDAEAQPGAPSWTPTYGHLIAAGFTDLWEKSFRARFPGYTCCRAKDLRNDRSELDQRLDFVLIRGDEELGLSRRRAVRMDLVGNRFWERTRGADRLWPSDHAGVLAGLVLR